ncbi:type II toxin-antitoxin system YafO family toxin [Salmonella enterica]|nr:hypothetical protein [Salmonella enterica subsp. enterica]EEH9316151.1 hypothetical protein [Salmonella enterica]EHP9583935.1 type II toxin-antitoxin system YafO family toxin [Salmonella enterica subsp. houtenae serovar 50:g,z51:-]EGF0591902.1 hypothetical protein [Salmonella enterica]EJN8362199.1 type II toxin-antitoxin system YafO family toxin [Salmonella enterica]
MARVSIHPSLKGLALVQGLARELSLYLSGVSLSGRLGRNGGFERNNSAQTSGILKIHFKAPGEGFWPDTTRQSTRTSNNYIVYARHWDKIDTFQIIAMISPDAHETSDALLPQIIDVAERDFHSLNDSEIDNLEHY